MGLKGHIDGYSVRSHTSPDGKMGRGKSYWTRGGRKVIKQIANKKRRQRDKRVDD